MKTIILCILLAGGFSDLTAAPVPDTVAREKKIGEVVRTVRQIDLTNDSIPETLQIETTKGRHFHNIGIRFAIYDAKGKKMYEKKFEAEDFFDKRDNISDELKWLRLQRILRVFFSDQNFSTGESESLEAMFKRVNAVDIKPGSKEAAEFTATPHKVFSVYAGRNLLYGLTWLASKKKFVVLWRN